jgi:hypothetical protein
MTARVYLARYSTQVEVTAYVSVPEYLFDDPDFDVDDYVGDESHRIATEHMDTWGTYRPVLFDGNLDGIGADEVEDTGEVVDE